MTDRDITPDYITIADFEAFERALDRLGVTKHARRGLARAGQFAGITILESEDCPRDKFAIVSGEHVKWLDLPKEPA